MPVLPVFRCEHPPLCSLLICGRQRTSRASLVGKFFSFFTFPDGKESACHAGDPGSIPGSEDPLEKEMATHSHIPAWRISQTEEPGGLQSMGSQRVGHDYAMLCYAKSLQSCPTLCNPIDGSLPGSPIPGILQARTLEWVALSFSNAGK